MEVTADERAEGSSDDDDGDADDDVLERFDGHLMHDECSPVRAEHAVDAHQRDSCRRRHLLRNSEKQGEHAVGEDVETTAGERRQHTAEETSEDEYFQL